MKKKQYIILFAILLVLAVICILLNNYIKNDGILINIATEFIGIILTIYFVDRIFKHYENEKWKGVDIKIKRYVHTLVNGTITSIRIAFGLRLEEIGDSKIFTESLESKNIPLMEKELIRISKEILEPYALMNLKKMNAKSYKLLNDELSSAYDSAERIVALFGSKLSANQFELILDVQDCIKGISTQQSIWPDYFGVPIENLPKESRVPTEEWQQQLYECLSNDIRSLLSTVRILYVAIEADKG